jgi:hypothetical protein
MTEKTRDGHLFGAGPKHILALDGGGIRGILTLQILRGIEGLIQKRSGKPNCKLSDCFDLIGGTSTGAVIATGLALGRSVHQLDCLYRRLGSLASLMDDAAALNEILLQWLSDSPTARTIDGEIGDLGGDLLGPEPLLTYLRYDVRLERDWLAEKLALELQEQQLASLHQDGRAGEPRPARSDRRGRGG